MEFEIYMYALFILTGFFAGFVDSIAGGGGIITLPVMLSAGIPPHIALATNKLQSSFGSFTATLNYTKKGLVNLKEVRDGVFFTFVGAATGAATLLVIDASFLSKFIPIMLTVIFLYTLFSPKIGEEDRARKMSSGRFYLLFGLLIGFYDGFFGPGTGAFWTIALVTLLGLNLKKATGQTKVMNFTSNIVSLGVFLFSGNLLFFVGIIMGLGQVAGAYLGSSLVVKKDVGFIRVIFLLVVGATIAKLFYENYLI